MQKLITVSQMREADSDCLKTLNILSVDLMEKAALAFTGVFCGLVPDKNKSIVILCGTGNNGGDGLAIARLLQCAGYSNIRVLLITTGKNKSSEFLINLERLKNTPIVVDQFQPDKTVNIPESIVVDAILGSGMDREISGDLLSLVTAINQDKKYVIAVDCPTGFRCEGDFSDKNTVLEACDVVSFQRPKLNFFFPESADFLQRFHVVNIGLRETFIESLSSDFYLLENSDISAIYRKRKNFSHKGTYGHAYIYAGSKGKSGAALLCTEACIYSGAGLTSLSLPEEDRAALHARLPEAMYLDREEAWEPRQRDKFSAIAVGPGLGKNADHLETMLKNIKIPLVIDADGLNFLSERPALLNDLSLSKNIILTPHMKEFDRLFGVSTSWWARLQLAIVKARELKVTIILKNRFTFIVLPDGRVLINPTGNPAMASGGMGDVLTGIIVSFLAQGYTCEEASILACYIHGRAGDLLAALGKAVIPASQLIMKLPDILGEIE